MKRIWETFKNRWFLIPFFSTLLLLFLAAGLLAVDYHSRAMTFDDTAPVFSLKETPESSILTIHAFGGETEWDVTGLMGFFRGFADFICFPHDEGV